MVGRQMIVAGGMAGIASSVGDIDTDKESHYAKLCGRVQVVNAYVEHGTAIFVHGWHTQWPQPQ